MCGLARATDNELNQMDGSGGFISRVMGMLERSQLNLSNPGWMGSQRASWLGTIGNGLWIHKVPARACISIYLDYSLPDCLCVTAKSPSPQYLALTIRHLLLCPKANSQGTGEGGKQPDCMGHHNGEGAALVPRKLEVLARQGGNAATDHRLVLLFARVLTSICNLSACNHKPNVNFSV